MLNSDSYLPLNITPLEFEKILRIAIDQPDIRQALLNSHDNNRWWPIHVRDWRTRMLIAGLSARISYRMLPIYREIVDKLDSLEWEEIIEMDEADFKKIIIKIGLYSNRTKFWRSITKFIEKIQQKGIDIFTTQNQTLIDLLQDEVDGASYKLAQCCVLYAKGYYCGIIPVDSGMKDVLGPCLGFPVPKGEYGHEALRIRLEKLTQLVDCKKIAYEHGYESLKFPDTTALSWFVHIALISYKRYFCNNRFHDICPIRLAMPDNIGKACAKLDNEIGGYRVIIVEGINGTGKSQLCKSISDQGFRKHHFDYIETNTGKDIVTLYSNLLIKSKNNRVVLDRSFMSEYAYGPVFRKNCRLTDDDFSVLVNMLIELKTIVIYLKAPKETIGQRLAGEKGKSILNNFNSLEERYEAITERLRTSHVPLVSYDTSLIDTSQIFSDLFN